MSTDKEIRELFAKHGVSLNRDDVWMVQASYVVKHKALERLAAALRIKYAPPQILRSERDEAVILVTGSLGDNVEWSIGEALVNANYRVTGKMAPYVYAMAEKRAKDRVIIKLAGLHGVYSEEEADEFRGEDRPSSRGEPMSAEEFSANAKAAFLTAMDMAKSVPDLEAWGVSNADAIKKLLPDDQNAVRYHYSQKMSAMKSANAKKAA